MPIVLARATTLWLKHPAVGLASRFPRMLSMAVLSREFWKIKLHASEMGLSWGKLHFGVHFPRCSLPGKCKAAKGLPESEEQQPPLPYILEMHCGKSSLSLHLKRARQRAGVGCVWVVGGSRLPLCFISYTLLPSTGAFTKSIFIHCFSSNGERGHLKEHV